MQIPNTLISSSFLLVERVENDQIVLIVLFNSYFNYVFVILFFFSRLLKGSYQCCVCSNMMETLELSMKHPSLKKKVNVFKIHLICSLLLMWKLIPLKPFKFLTFLIPFNFPPNFIELLLHFKNHICKHENKERRIKEYTFSLASSGSSMYIEFYIPDSMALLAEISSLSFSLSL